jgi:polyisoprenoid-binding protein YceI
MDPAVITPDQLPSLQRSHPDFVLLDVRLAEDFARGHLPAAINNCVFEVAFAERMKSLVPDLRTPVCCYGQSAQSHESRVASEKLQRLGYERVFDLRAGIASTQVAGPAPVDGSHPIDLSESRVDWTGRNLLNSHHGRLGLQSGHVIVTNGRLAGGELVMDMSAISCDDLAGTPLHEVLVAHLRNDDFFDTERFPTGRFVITSAVVPPDATAGAPNLEVTGELTLKGVTAPVRCTASAGVLPDGRLAAQATLEIDRCRWNVIYGSGRFFSRLGVHLVNDLIEVRLRLLTAPVPAAP